jgi:hypothetical protein
MGDMWPDTVMWSKRLAKPPHNIVISGERSTACMGSGIYLGRLLTPSGQSSPAAIGLPDQGLSLRIELLQATVSYNTFSR